MKVNFYSLRTLSRTIRGSESGIRMVTSKISEAGLLPAMSTTVLSSTYFEHFPNNLQLGWELSRIGYDGIGRSKLRSSNRTSATTFPTVTLHKTIHLTRLVKAMMMMCWTSQNKIFLLNINKLSFSWQYKCFTN